MALVRSPDPAFYARQAAREILIWTTRDGREIPLDEMSDDHIANAVRVLTLWRVRLKKRGGDERILRDLKDAITRFKALQRKRRKPLPALTGPKLQPDTKKRAAAGAGARLGSSFGRRPKPR